jgi:hypothetical protein
MDLSMTTIERLWNPFQTCSTEDNRPVELKFDGAGDVHLGYFSSSQGRWVHADGAPFPEGLYPSHWRSPSPAPGGMGDLADKLSSASSLSRRVPGFGDIILENSEVALIVSTLRTAAQSAEVRERTIELPLAVRLRDEEGPPLPQMMAQRRAQLSIERTREHTEFQNADALADEYESGLKKMEASSYEEFADIIPKHKLIIKALRAFRSLAQAGGKL